MSFQKKLLNAFGLLLLMFSAAQPTLAGPIDLSSWSELTLDLSGGQPPGNWVLGGGNTTVTQTVNADPSFYLNNLNQTSYTMDGSWRVNTTGDDDFMGFVFGYQNSSNFYLFDWKQNAQNAYSASATEGMSIRKMTGATGSGLADLSLGEFWENDTNSGDSTILATNHGSTKGWADNVLYDFQLDFKATGEFDIKVSQGVTTLWDVNVVDNTFTAGQFGFYNFSQSTVEYAGFEQEGGVIVPLPAPAPAALLLLGLAGLMLGRNKQSA